MVTMAVKTVYIIIKLVHGFKYYLKTYGMFDQFHQWEGLINNATVFDYKERAEYTAKKYFDADDFIDIIPHTIITE